MDAGATAIQAHQVAVDAEHSCCTRCRGSPPRWSTPTRSRSRHRPACGARPAPLTRPGIRCETGRVDEQARARAAAYVPDLARLAAVILVEGLSDQSALHALARRRGRDLGQEGVSVVPMGGATNIGHFLTVFGPHGLDVRLAGLCDLAEEPGFRRGLQRVGLGSPLGRADLERLGFFVCAADLEDELIRSLGIAAVSRSWRRRAS